jgi:1-deoxy-D-xylulose-5-phosphate reductoisomerase
MSGTTRRLVILGSTGSIGTQALEVVEHVNALHDAGRSPLRFEVVGLAAGRNGALLAEQARRHGVRRAALREGPVEGSFEASWEGADAAERLVRETECDLVLAAMVGASGVPATLAAANLGRDIALANKETLVAAGELVVPAARRTGARLLPVDSEHCGVWQCLTGRCGGATPPFEAASHVRRITLTASGGPFRTWTREQMASATPEQARRHPTWSMGDKVTIDSASLTNKALELIEAHWLFGIDPERLGAVIHPQSIVHAFVEFADRSTLAQLATPDMRTPIHAALAWPFEMGGVGRELDLAAMSALTFEPVDETKFPAVATAREVMRRGGTSGAIFNAANEEAVHAFIAGRIRFPAIASLSAEAIDAIPTTAAESAASIHDADARARAWVASRTT